MASLIVSPPPLGPGMILDVKLRHEDVFEFLHDLQHPNPHFLNTTATPLIERNPILVWKGLSVISIIVNLILFYYLVQ